MDFVSAGFYLFLTAVLVLYYLFPLSCRWWVLLGGNLLYFWLAAGSVRGSLVFSAMIVISYLLGLMLEKAGDESTYNPGGDRDGAMPCACFWRRLSF